MAWKGGRRRPGKLTPEAQARICEEVAQGLHLRFACALAGADYAALRRWLASGAPQARQFQEAVARAEAEAFDHAVAQWRSACATDPRARRALRAFLARRAAMPRSGPVAPPGRGAGPFGPAPPPAARAVLSPAEVLRR